MPPKENTEEKKVERKRPREQDEASEKRPAKKVKILDN